MRDLLIVEEMLHILFSILIFKASRPKVNLKGDAIIDAFDGFYLYQISLAFEVDDEGLGFFDQLMGGDSEYDFR